MIGSVIGKEYLLYEIAAQARNDIQEILFYGIAAQARNDRRVKYLNNKNAEL